MIHTREFRGKVQRRAEEIAAEGDVQRVVAFYTDLHRAFDRLQEMSSGQMSDRTMLPEFIGDDRVVCENLVMVRFYQQSGRLYLVDLV